MLQYLSYTPIKHKKVQNKMNPDSDPNNPNQFSPTPPIDPTPQPTSNPADTPISADPSQVENSQPILAVPTDPGSPSATTLPASPTLEANPTPQPDPVPQTAPSSQETPVPQATPQFNPVDTNAATPVNNFTNPATTVTPAANTPASTAAPKSNKTLLIVLGAVVAVVIIALIGVVIATVSNSGGDNNSNGNNNDSNGSGSLVNPNVGGTLTVGDVTLTYSDSWAKDDSSNPAIGVITSSSDAMVLSVFESSDSGYTLSEFTQKTIDSYIENGYTISIEPEIQNLNGYDWEYVRVKDSSDTIDLWFYVNKGSQYYVIARSTDSVFKTIPAETQAVLDSITIR